MTKNEIFIMKRKEEKNRFVNLEFYPGVADVCHSFLQPSEERNKRT